ncbi:uncharacterized protein LOC129598212 [Paramacrobiotus metropolitanus]|uniref:uncharacterized protein LOC129598212 n=1 Tax=Paramacrobiotus metropolitanus TaxID=2943436 RepID=UPI0024459694|nr:uncharacterized protein LOC129598212 [Paramacrobiotus metropolitanus]
METSIAISRRCFKARHDLPLLEQVQHYNPYASDDREGAWKSVVESLNDAKLFERPLDVRAVKERLSTLVTSYQANDLRNKSKIGTEEQYGRMEQLLDYIASLIKSAAKEKEEKKKAAKEKETRRDRTASLMRAAGETGRAGPDYTEATEKMDKETFLRETGLDERDWEEELRTKRAVSVADDLASSSSSSALPSSRNASKKSEAETDMKWMEFFREQEEKKLQFEEKKG